MSINLKILIITLYGEHNYGNKFQNYALQTVIEKYNCECYTLNNENLSRNYICNQEEMKIWTRIRRNLKFHQIKRIISGMKNKICFKIKRKMVQQRHEKFCDFSRKYIKQCKSENYDEINKEFDAICLGSDQIWNPYYMNNFEYAYGMFSNNVFSYAASFGIDEIPSKYIEKVKYGLNRIKNISVREERGAQIVKEITGKDAKVVLDPTLLLTQKEWSEVEKRSESSPKGKYVFLYFLGNLKRKAKKKIEEFARENKLEIVYINQKILNNYYTSAPGEFLYLLKNSEIVITDSFHGTVFSIIYQKPFYVIEREDSDKKMNSRIESLFKLLDVKNRFLDSDLHELNRFNLECDFTTINSKLDNLRKKSLEYIEKTIEDENNRRIYENKK